MLSKSIFGKSKKSSSPDQATSKVPMPKTSANFLSPVSAYMAPLDIDRLRKNFWAKFFICENLQTLSGISAAAEDTRSLPHPPRPSLPSWTAYARMTTTGTTTARTAVTTTGAVPTITGCAKSPWTFQAPETDLRPFHPEAICFMAKLRVMHWEFSCRYSSSVLICKLCLAKFCTEDKFEALPLKSGHDSCQHAIDYLSKQVATLNFYLCSVLKELFKIYSFVGYSAHLRSRHWL